MRNLNFVVTGNTGSGKTRFVHWLLRSTPRYVVFDPLEDYETDAPVVRSFNVATSHFLKHKMNPGLRFVFAGDSSSFWEGDYDESDFEDFRAFLKWVTYTQYYYALPPIALIFEEAHFYVEPDKDRKPWSEIRALHRWQGRRAQVSSISVAQSAVDLSPQFRRSARNFIAFNEPEAPIEFRRMFSDGEKLVNLEPYRGVGDPVYGKHFITSPANLDIKRLWRDTLRAPARESTVYDHGRALPLGRDRSGIVGVPDDGGTDDGFGADSRPESRTDEIAS